MSTESEHISHNIYGNANDNPYCLNPREKAHNLLDTILDGYDRELAFENKLLRQENNSLREELTAKNNTIKALNTQINELVKALGTRSIKQAKKKSKKTKEKIENNFSKLIQHTDKPKVLKRLHELIDGKSGMLVGAVLKKAANDKILIRTPKEKEYKSEFELKGTWRSISNYFDDSKQKVKEAVNNIIIF